MTTFEQLKAAKKAAPSLSLCTEDEKNIALERMADSLLLNEDTILQANRKDMDQAKDKITPVMLDRLALDQTRITAMADGIRAAAKLEDPCGVVLERKTRPNGLIIDKITVPLGVIAIIYESRPNVTSDAAALAIKAGSACVLRCGREAYQSAEAITTALRQGLVQAGMDENLLSLVSDPSRDSARELMNAEGLIDLLIPRGGAGLIRACVENAKVPVLRTGTGICHIYVEKSADFSIALNIIENAKAQRPSVCNAAEVCLIDAAIAEQFLPMLKKRLGADRTACGKTPVSLRLCKRAAKFIDGTPAGENDFDTEFLDYILAVRVVDGLAEAVAHIAAHSTSHSEAIVTTDEQAAKRFCAMVDSAAVYVNASTRFTDGGEFGLGCEMGISTQKLHARGPVGLRELVSYKYIITGNGQIR